MRLALATDGSASAERAVRNHRFEIAFKLRDGPRRGVISADFEIVLAFEGEKGANFIESRGDFVLAHPGIIFGSAPSPPLRGERIG